MVQESLSQEVACQGISWCAVTATLEIFSHRRS